MTIHLVSQTGIILHTSDNGYKFADIDLKSEDGVQAILEAIAKVVDWAYMAAVQQ
jgi:photosystem II stability/assembly factor-like uncharacterized protein